MRVFIACSRRFYWAVPEVKKTLENLGFITVLPTQLDNPDDEDNYKKRSQLALAKFKEEMVKDSIDKIMASDVILVLNYKDIAGQNYIGGATFLEMYDAYRFGKDIFILNPVTTSTISDEICGFRPIFLNGDLRNMAPYLMPMKGARKK